MAFVQSASTRQRMPRPTVQIVQPDYTRLPTLVMAAAPVTSRRGITKSSSGKANARAAQPSPALLRVLAVVEQVRGTALIARQAVPLPMVSAQSAQAGTTSRTPIKSSASNVRPADIRHRMARATALCAWRVRSLTEALQQPQAPAPRALLARTRRRQTWRSA